MAVSAPPSALRSTGLGAAHVHDDVPHVAGEAEPSGHGRGLEGLVATPAPLNSIVSMPASPSTRSLASPGFQTRVSFPAPPNMESFCCWPTIRSGPSPPVRTSAPVAAVRSRAGSARPDPASTAIVVVAAETVDGQVVVGAFRVVDLDGHRSPEDVHGTLGRGDLDVVGEVRAVDRDRVGRAVARAAADRGREVESDTTLRPVAAVLFRTALSLPPSARTSMNSMSFRSIVMLPTSRKNLDSSAVGRDVEALGHACAVEEHRVGAVLTTPSMMSLPSPGSQVNESSPGAQPAPRVRAAVAVDRSRCRRRRSGSRLRRRR